MVKGTAIRTIADHSLDIGTESSSYQRPRDQERSEIFERTKTEYENITVSDYCSESQMTEASSSQVQIHVDPEISETCEQRKDEYENITTLARHIPLPPMPQERSNNTKIQTKIPLANRSTVKARRKTLIMLTMTTVFIITTILYLTLLN